MKEMLGEMHYMPDSWKQRPHTVEVYREVTHVFQFTMVRGWRGERREEG